MRGCRTTFPILELARLKGAGASIHAIQLDLGRVTVMIFPALHSCKDAAHKTGQAQAQMVPKGLYKQPKALVYHDAHNPHKQNAVVSVKELET